MRYESGLLDTAGNAAHAATYIRKRLILLDAELRGNKAVHQRILLHEVFHFAWVKLGNPRRRSWEELLHREWAGRARGETGWSAEWRKRELRAEQVAGRHRAWREYCCESFCDTGAWLGSGAEAERTLATRHSAKRKTWFDEVFATRWIAI